METGVPGKIAFVVKGYPRLSETFIAQEILALERRGFDILIVSLRHPSSHVVVPGLLDGLVNVNRLVDDHLEPPSKIRRMAVR